MRSVATTGASLMARAVPAASPTSQVRMWLWCLRGPCAPLVLPCRSSRNTGAAAAIDWLGSTSAGRSSYSTSTRSTASAATSILRYDKRNLLALKQHLLVGQDGLDIARERRHPMQFQRLQVFGGQHRLDPGQRQRGPLVDRFDAGVAMGRADEIAKQHAR